MPLEIYKVLGQVQADGTATPVSLYTVPANALAKVRVTVSSSDAGTHQFTIAVSKNGAAIANGDKIYDAVDLLKNSSFTTAELTLAAGDIIRVFSSAGAATFTFQAHGVELYTPSVGVYFDVIENGVTNTVRLYNIEQNLRWIYETDEDCQLRIGFDGYGPDNELTIDFPSPTERATFRSAFEQARLYGTYDGIDPVTPMVYLGNNTILGISTTTTSTTTTTTVAPATTTTTAAPTTTTTAGPPTVSWSWYRYPSASAAFEAWLNIDTAPAPQGEAVDTATGYFTAVAGDLLKAVVYASNATLVQIVVTDVTDPNNPVLLTSVPTNLDPQNGAVYQPGDADTQEVTLELGKAYHIEATATV